jgi:endonuclease/exonuclease/phosphatase family metal-dependent hydrolase
VTEVSPEKKRHWTWRRILALAGLLFAAFATYRVFAVYTVRTGSCDFPITRGELVRAGAPRFPSRQESARAGRSLVVMTYNIEGHAALFRADHLEKIAATIRETRPDIVGLQEVHRGTWQSRFTDQAEELARLTNMNSAYGRSFNALGGEFGNAILTRGTILSSKTYALPSLGEPRSLLQATIDIDGNRLNYFITHLATWGKVNRSSRLEQLQCIAEHVRRSTLPYIVVGDFNVIANTPELQWFIKSALVNVSGGTDDPTHRLTRQRLDYLFADPGWYTKSARVLHIGASDHWPVIAELQWEKTGE